jgi:hypothetical protein
MIMSRIDFAMIVIFFLFVSISGIHKLFHCAPNVPHYAKNKAVGVMKPGHAFTIEPMISEGLSSKVFMVVSYFNYS